VVHKRDEPNVLVDLFHPHDLADVDVAALVTEATAGGDWHFGGANHHVLRGCLPSLADSLKHIAYDAIPLGTAASRLDRSIKHV
jgi:hypothetical protein